MLVYALSTLALAFDSTAQPIATEQSVDLFDNVEISTGRLPSSDSPLQVEVGLLTTGGATVAVEGTAELSWPEALTLGFQGQPGGGTYQLDTSLDAVTTVYVDVFGYGGSFEIDRRSMPIGGDTPFDTFQLGQRVEVVDSLDATSLLDYSWSIGPVELRFLGEMQPVVTAGYTSLSWSANGNTVTSDGETLPLPVQRAPQAAADATLRGRWDGRIDLVLRPAMEACIDVVFYSDCFEVASFDFPIEIAGDTKEVDFPTQALTFPLPMLEVGLEAGDFGEVEPGSTANLQVPLRNLGELAAEGTVSIRGDGAFTVFPTSFRAEPGVEDGVMVSFAPTAEGAVTAELVVTSNDPSAPEIVLALSGNGVVPVAEEESGVAGEEGGKAEVSACGCSSGPETGAPMAVFAVGFGLVALRRRGKPRA
jgi:MYXO-CTERM domain-containing protein